MFAKIVNVIEGLALVMAAVFVVLLFAYRPTRPHVTAGSTGTPSGQAIFAENCSSCHGAHGEGDIGPKLSGGEVVARFPNPADEIAVVTNGLGGSMPAWSGKLTPAQINAVVEYTRTGL